MSKQNLNKLKKEELINIILRKDDVEAKIKADAEQAYNKLNAKLADAEKDINSYQEELDVAASDKALLVSQLREAKGIILFEAVIITALIVSLFVF